MQEAGYTISEDSAVIYNVECESSASDVSDTNHSQEDNMDGFQAAHNEGKDPNQVPNGWVDGQELWDCEGLGDTEAVSESQNDTSQSEGSRLIERYYTLSKSPNKPTPKSVHEGRAEGLEERDYSNYNPSCSVQVPLKLANQMEEDWDVPAPIPQEFEDAETEKVPDEGEQFYSDAKMCKRTWAFPVESTDPITQLNQYIPSYSHAIRLSYRDVAKRSRYSNMRYIESGQFSDPEDGDTS